VGWSGFLRGRNPVNSHEKHEKEYHGREKGERPEGENASNLRLTNHGKSVLIREKVATEREKEALFSVGRRAQQKM